MKLPALLLIAVFVVAVAQSAYYYPRLPERVASHFGASGAADGWQSRPAFFAFYGALLALLFLVFGLGPRLLRRLPPSLVNIPHRDYWLTPARRAEAMRRLELAMQWFAVPTIGFMVFAMQLVFAANLDQEPRLPGTFLWALGAYFAFVASWLVWLYRGLFRPPAGG